MTQHVRDALDGALRPTPNALAGPEGVHHDAMRWTSGQLRHVRVAEAGGMPIPAQRRGLAEAVDDARRHAEEATP